MRFCNIVGVFILATATVKGIVYLGCYKDDKGKRVLPKKLDDSNINTPAQCARRCSQYRYAGVEHKTLCFCGNALTATKQSDNNCQEECAGNRSEICGDEWWISVYTNWVTACGPSPDIANGIATLRNGTNLGYGSIADVHCAPGFIGKSNITCFSNTSWEITTCQQSGTGNNSTKSTTGAITANELSTTDGYTSKLSFPYGSSAHGTSTEGTTQSSIHKHNTVPNSLTNAHFYGSSTIDFNAKIHSPRETTNNTTAIDVYISVTIGLLCVAVAVVVIIVLWRRGALACKNGTNTETTYTTNTGSLAITNRSHGDTVETHNYFILEKRAQSVQDDVDHYNTADESYKDNRDTDNYNSIDEENDNSVKDANGEYDYTTNAVCTRPKSRKPDKVYNKLKKYRPGDYDHVGRRGHNVSQSDNDYNTTALTRRNDGDGDYNHIPHPGNKRLHMGVEKKRPLTSRL